MAVKKRATKKKAAKKSATPRRSAKKKKQPRLKKFLLLALACAFFLFLALGATYYFASFETRAKLNQPIMRTLNTVRLPSWMPRPIAWVFDNLYDTLPSSEGLLVDGGELGRSDAPILAGMPQSRKAVRVLNNNSYINLYDEKGRQSLCLALRLSDTLRQKVKSTEDYYEDPRVAPLRASEMTFGQWSPHPIAPAKTLAGEYGATGASEAHLTTNLAPMTEAYAEGIWKDAMKRVAEQYPKRFGEIWIYMGPAYRKQSSKLSSGILIPDAFYLVAFDLTESGGLRAISFLIPTETTPGTSLADCLTSIGTIEQMTGLQFLPELSFDARDVLETWVSPNLW